MLGNMFKINLLFIFCFYPIVTTQIIDDSNRISRQKCKEYSQSFSFVGNACNFDQNTLNPGINSAVVDVMVDSEGKQVRSCSGILISEQFVITTAYCAKAGKNSAKKVRLGELHNNKTQNIQEIKVTEKIAHPEYNWKQYNNIALLKLEHPVKFNLHVRPACLPELNQKHIKTYILSGFEETEMNKYYLKNYKNVEEIPHELCNGYYSREEKLPHGIDIDTHFCAGPVDMVCKYLNGAALQTYDEKIKCMFDVNAILSFGKLCSGRTPTVFTKIAPYIDWIEENVWP